MMSTPFVFYLVTILLISEISCLTMLGLERRPRNSQEKVLYFPEEDDAPVRNADTAVDMDKSFIRVIGDVAGREIIPRRWTSNDKVTRVVLDENELAIPVREQPLLSRLLGRQGGLYGTRPV